MSEKSTATNGTLKSYVEARSWIEGLVLSVSVLAWSGLKLLMERLGSPERRLKFIHVQVRTAKALYVPT